MNIRTWPEELRRLRAMPNRGQSHVFLGDALSETCDKTTVEPGNVFSPGVWTCGVSVGLWLMSGWIFPDDLPLSRIEWRFEDGDEGAGVAPTGAVPILRSRWEVDGSALTTRLGHIGGVGASGVDYLEATAEHAPGSRLGILVRDIGPAGAHISGLKWDAGSKVLAIEGGPRLCFSRAPEAVQRLDADEEFDSPLVLLSWWLGAKPFMLRFRVEHGFRGRAFASSLPQNPHGPPDVRRALARASSTWKRQLPARVWAPDARVARTWEMCAHHLLAACECGQARIGAVNYPHFWMRDGIIAARALDLIGRGDLARLTNEALAPTVFSGGFGAESDAPGEGLWSLISHARLSRDWEWLRGLWPHIQARVVWIEKMLRAEEPLRAVGENRMPRYLDTPALNVVCLPAQDGLIHGRMDWHSPDFYINAWAARGLRDASDAAAQLGFEDESERWQVLADALESALRERGAAMWGNDRDPAISPHPTRALCDGRNIDALREKFRAWFLKHRLAEDGSRVREPLWTYFEAAQAHNALLLGLRDEAWQVLDGLLSDDESTAAFGEGSAGGNEFLPFGNGAQRRGWLDSERAGAGNMPHNWTTSELLLCLRDVFVRDDDGDLVLGDGVPRSWLVPGASWGVRDLPTQRGNISYRATVEADGEVGVAYHLDGPAPTDWWLETRESAKPVARLSSGAVPILRLYFGPPRRQPPFQPPR